MKYFIKIDSNNDYIGHPINETNLKRVFPDFDFSKGTPNGYLEFIRVPEPRLKPYEQFDESKGSVTSEGYSHNGLEYKLIDGKYTDFWNIISISEEDKKKKQDAAKEVFSNSVNKDCTSWTWNEEECAMMPPIPFPIIEEGSDDVYQWNESNRSWDKIS